MVDEGSLLGTSHIEYDIEITRYAQPLFLSIFCLLLITFKFSFRIKYNPIAPCRTTDNESHKVTKRFREVNDFYNLLVRSELVANSTGLVFPSKGMGFAEAVDPDSSYVQKRKVDLQVSIL